MAEVSAGELGERPEQPNRETTSRLSLVLRGEAWLQSGEK